MRLPLLTAAAVVAGVLLAPLSARAATPVFLTIDQSSDIVLDKATAQATWKRQLDDKLVKRLAKLYPVGKWGFISEVEGGFNADKTCIVTARAMLVPRSGKRLVFEPNKMATAFDAKPGATAAECRALATAKLGDAIGSVIATLAKQ